MKAGFIGTGSMGSILIEALIRSESLRADSITISNRTKSKALDLADKFPGLSFAESNQEVVRSSEIVFICVKPLEYKKVIDEIQPELTPQQIVVSITSPVLIRHLEAKLPCKIAKMIPSITNYQLSGASLCMYGSRMSEADCDSLEALLKPISKPIRISEEFTRVISDLSSCGPAFLSFFMQKFIEAAVLKTGIPETEATALASEMLLGTGKLLTSGEFSPESLKQRVSVPGGITAEALKILEVNLEGVFEQLIETTHAKYHEDVEKIEHLLFEAGSAHESSMTGDR